MSSTDEKRYFLNEHVAYEVSTMREAYRRLLTTEDQVDWNIAFKAFVSSARCLKEFFSDGHSNAKAKEYVKGFKPPPHKLRGVLRHMNQQVEHVAKERPYNAKDKFGIEEAGRVLEWIEECLAAFTEALPSSYSKDWLPPKPQTIPVNPSAPGASAQPIPCSSTFSMTTLTHSESAAPIAWRGVSDTEDDGKA